MSSTHGLQGILDRYGAITVQNGQIVAPHGWEARWMTRFQHRLIPGTLYVNRDIVQPLADALDACAATGVAYQIRQIGCFAPRAKRGNAAQLSVHSWGLAVDINPDANPRGAPLRTDIPPAWIEAFKRRGWVWGGDFRTPDTMHLQYLDGY